VARERQQQHCGAIWRRGARGLTIGRAPPACPCCLRHPQDKAAVLADVRSIISEQLGTDLDKVGLDAGAG
jgi:hypothetical protein